MAIIKSKRPTKSGMNSAIMQAVGFVNGRDHGDTVAFIEQMGLTKREWGKIREDGIFDNYGMRADIDAHFSKTSIKLKN